MEQRFRNFVNDVIQQVRPHASVRDVEECPEGENWRVILTLTKVDFSVKMEFIITPDEVRHKHRVYDYRDFIVTNYQELRRSYNQSN